MARALRDSAAHVFVASLEDPVLDDTDLHHLTRVLRIRPDDPVTLTDGAGGWAEGRLRDGFVQLIGPVSVEPQPLPLTIAVSIPKGDRLEWMVQKLTELGVTSVQLIDCERSVVRWDRSRADKQFARLRRIAREAAMQSRRVRLPELSGVRAFSDVVAELAVSGSGAVLADPAGSAIEPGAVTTVVIGPEGGFTLAELNVGLPLASVSPHVLRVETAALAAATLLAR